MVGLIFGEYNGGAVTLSNLFKKFRKNDLAVIAQDSMACLSDLHYCSKVYQLGALEKRSGLLFKLSNPGLFSGPITKQDIRNSQVEIKEKHGSLFYRIAYYGLRACANFCGLNHSIYHYEISDRLDEWINDFKPDIIYTQLASVPMMRFVRDLNDRYNIPLVIHMADDWPTVINRPNLMYFKWKKTIKKELQILFSKASLCMGISEGMEREYGRRYGLELKTFYNPIDIKKWLPYQKKDWRIVAECRILYLGSINIFNNKTLQRFAQAVERLNESGQKVRFDLYSRQYNDPIARPLRNKRGVGLKPPVKHASLPKLVSNYDLNLLPLNFDKISKRLTDFSFSTKTSEYMISAVPIIVCANSKSEYYRHAEKYGWGVVIESNEIKKIEAVLQILIDNKKLREMIARNATEYAKNNCEVEPVSNEFKNLIVSTIYNGYGKK